MTKKTKLFTTILSVYLACGTLLSLWGVTPAAQAQTAGFAISVSPPVSYLAVKPGETVVWRIKLKNESLAPVTLTPQLLDLKIPDDGRGVAIGDASTFPYQPSLKLPATVVIEPGDTTQLSLEVTVPATAPSQEYHQTVVFTAAPTLDSTQPASQAEIGGAIASNLILSVIGNPPPQSQLQLQTAQVPKIMDSFRPLQFHLVAKNTGNQVGLASGSAKLINWRGTVTKTWEFFPDRVLAGSPRILRTFDLNTPRDASDSTLTALDKFEYQPHFWIGPYRLEVWLSPNGLTPPELVMQTVVWALPLSTSVIIITFGLIYAGYQRFLALRRKPNFPIGK